jgi:hypothetical protein
VAQRENEIANAIRTQIVKEHEDALTEARAAVEGLRGELTALAKRYDGVIEDFEVRGVTPGYPHRRTRDTSEIFPASFEVKDLNRTVEGRLREMRATTGYQRLNLKQMELEIQEALAIDALETEDAREFLDRVPTVEKLLPLPEPLKALMDAGGDDEDDE